MNTTYYITEIDGKPIIGGGWENGLEQAKRAARASVTNAPEPTYVAVVGDFDVEFSVARQDHPEAHHADEVQVSPEVHISAQAFHIGQAVQAAHDYGTRKRGAVGYVVGFQNYTGRMTGAYVVVQFGDTPDGGECALPSEIEAVTA